MGTRERRQREAAKRRKTILAAAKNLFWKQGYSRTTIPQIARATELAPGTLYLYFPGKEALYVELLFEGYDLLEKRLLAAAEASATRRPEALIDAFFAFAKENPEYFDIIFFLSRREGGIQEEKFPPEKVSQLDARVDACKAVAAKALRAAGDRKGDKAHRRTVDAVWSMMSGVILFFQREEGFGALAAEAKRVILRGVFGSR